MSEAEEDGSSWEGQDDPEEAALLRLESDLLAAEAAASDLLLLEDAVAAPELPPAVATEAEEPMLPPASSVYAFTPAAARRPSLRGGCPGRPSYRTGRRRASGPHNPRKP